MIVKLLTEHHLEFLSLKGGCRGSSESTHVKIPYCWKSHALAHFISIGLHCLSKYLFTCIKNKKKVDLMFNEMSQCMRFTTIWYVRPAKPQISLRIRAV